MNVIKTLIILISSYPFLYQTALSNLKNSTLYSVSKFSNIVTDELVKSNIPGAAVAVVSKDRILYMKVYGVKSLETNAPVNKHTLFRIASVSKFFTALLFCRLDEKGLINLNHSAINYLPTLFLSPKIKFAKVRIIDILTHTSGAPKYSLEDQAYSRIARDSLFKNIKKVNLLDPPGKVHRYQNVIYSLLGLIVESITGKDFSVVLEKEILEPLNIKNYTLCDEDYGNHNNAAQSHTLNKETNLYRISNCSSSYDNILPAAGIAISINDATKIVQDLLGSNKIFSKRLIDRLVLQKIQTCDKNRPCKKSCFCKKELTTYYGLGCRIVNIHRHDVIYHAGYVHGYASIIAIIPDLDVGLIVFTNGDTNLPHYLLDKFCTIILKEKLKSKHTTVK